MISEKLPWPLNIFDVLGIYNIDKVPTDDQIDGLTYVLDQLDEKSRVSIYLFYAERETLSQISDTLNLTLAETQTLINHAIKFMQQPDRIIFIEKGLQEMQTSIKSQTVVSLTEWKNSK